MRHAGTFRSETGKRLVAVLGALWLAFSAGPMIQASLDAWGDLARELSSGHQAVKGEQGSESSGPDATER
jgi:hypothetical protein